MSDVNPGDLVVNSDPSVIGEVLPASTTRNGLHRAAELDLWDAGAGPSFANSGLVPVRWNTDSSPYEYWENPEFLTVVRPAVAASLTVH